ncbi:MLF1 factor, partial [Phaetusa simplex]|nr:MLF1 factor [Phaetusa simplex]
IFSDPFAAHHEYMRQMMRSFSDPFGRDPFLSITDGGERTVDRRARQDSQVAVRGNRRVSNFGEPFFAMDRMMSNMRNSMLEMQRKFDDLSIHPDAHTFSSSSVMTYSKVGDEPPKVFQASAQTRTAPGGVITDHKFKKHCSKNLISISCFFLSCLHLLKIKANSNCFSAEARTFDEEWQKEIMKFKPSRTRCNLEAPKYRSIHHIPKEDGSRREKPLAVAGSREPRASLENLRVKGTHVPIKSSKK